ncbi:MAG: hypothetical protein ACYS7Y_27360 [Planctomycetota bacterium]|jgi:hypothetical protein
MTITQQRTFGAVVGLDPVVAVVPHRNDPVECSDGTIRRHCDVCYDCVDGAHSNDSDRHDAEVTIVTDLLNSIGKWADEYCTENTDYADGYSCLVDDDQITWKDRTDEWVCEYVEYQTEFGDRDDLDEIVKSVSDSVFEALDGSSDCELEYTCNEYSCYDGDGCCLGSWAIGEHEEQIDISNHDELQALHERGALDDILDDVNCDVYVSRRQRREKNEETGYYENVGRETYMPYAHNAEYPTFEVYTNPGGQWRFVVSAERMEELVRDALAEFEEDA